jgi:hypothetical protein
VGNINRNLYSATTGRPLLGSISVSNADPPKGAQGKYSLMWGKALASNIMPLKAYFNTSKTYCEDISYVYSI